MSTPTDGPLDPFGPGGPLVFSGPGAALLGLWAKPIQPLVPEVRQAIRKPLAEVTMYEVLACAVTFGYIFSSMLLAQTMMANLVKVAVRGR